MDDEYIVFTKYARTPLTSEDFLEFKQKYSFEEIPGEEGEERIFLGLEGVTADLVCSNNSVMIEFQGRTIKKNRKALAEKWGWTFK